MSPQDRGGDGVEDGEDVADFPTWQDEAVYWFVRGAQVGLFFGLLEDFWDWD